jgi:hypothetical protein
MSCQIFTISKLQESDGATTLDHSEHLKMLSTSSSTGRKNIIKVEEKRRRKIRGKEERQLINIKATILMPIIQIEGRTYPGTTHTRIILLLEALTFLKELQREI